MTEMKLWRVKWVETRTETCEVEAVDEEGAEEAAMSMLVPPDDTYVDDFEFEELT